MNFSLEIEFYKKRADRKFIFNDQQQRNATGLTSQEFEELVSYLEPFSSYFVKVSVKEAVNLLFIYVR